MEMIIDRSIWEILLSLQLALSSEIIVCTSILKNRTRVFHVPLRTTTASTSIYFYLLKSQLLFQSLANMVSNIFYTTMLSDIIDFAHINQHLPRALKRPVENTITITLTTNLISYERQFSQYDSV